MIRGGRREEGGGRKERGKREEREREERREERGERKGREKRREEKFQIILSLITLQQKRMNLISKLYAKDRIYNLIFSIEFGVKRFRLQFFVSTVVSCEIRSIQYDNFSGVEAASR